MGHQSFFKTEKSPQTRMNTKKNVPDSKIRHIIWWGKMDSNHRSQRQQIYSLPPLATREFPLIHLTPFLEGEVYCIMFFRACQDQVQVFSDKF